MSLVVPQGCITVSSASLVWTPVEGAAEYCVYCNGRLFKKVRGCSLGVRGLLHDHTYRFEVRALLGRAEMACGEATLTTMTSPVEYDARRYGADPGGRQDSTDALQRAIDACKPGGMVYLGAGQYRLAGTLRLKSGLCLYLEPQAVLQGPTFVGSGLHDVSMMGGRWEPANLCLQNSKRICLRDIATGNAVQLTGCRDVTLDNAGIPQTENCQRVYLL